MFFTFEKLEIVQHSISVNKPLKHALPTTLTFVAL